MKINKKNYKKLNTHFQILFVKQITKNITIEQKTNYIFFRRSLKK